MTTAFLRLVLPFTFRHSAFCALRSFFSARRKNFGAVTFRPSEVTAKCVNPRSIPTSDSISGNGSSVVCTTTDAKYRPEASLTTVTELGSDGSERDQRTATSPIFGSRSFPPAVTAKRELFVNRMACRLSLRDRYRGGATLRPLRLPEMEAKKLR
ncbi:MAG: hypothetical protein JWN00_2170 [Actinomycetia bacterium]|nr:hypothetical protein [Actinomycetes bacterium]